MREQLDSTLVLRAISDGFKTMSDPGHLVSDSYTRNPVCRLLLSTWVAAIDPLLCSFQFLSCRSLIVLFGSKVDKHQGHQDGREAEEDCLQAAGWLAERVVISWASLLLFEAAPNYGEFRFKREVIYITPIYQGSGEPPMCLAPPASRVFLPVWVCSVALSQGR
jgi:hypothetical protein